MLVTVWWAGMPLPGAGGVHVLPSSVLRKTPPEKTPASIVPPGTETSDCTDSLSFFGLAGLSSGPCASGFHWPPPSDLKTPRSVPA
jgi:hypothetical protein